MNLILKAARFAAEAHKGQFRKYSPGIPYITHPIRVAGRIMLEPWATEEHAAAAFLHDVVEDCPVSIDDIQREFGTVVAIIVGGLTNPSKGSKASRAERKRQDREHIASAPWEIKAIKIADRTDNLRDMLNADAGFMELYLRESEELLKVISDAPVANMLKEYMDAMEAIRTIVMA